MKTWKQIGSWAVLALALALGACDSGNDAGHSHSFGTAWVTNASQHWHECSCGEKSGLANHAFENDACTVCGYENPVLREATINLDLGIWGGACTAIVNSTLTSAQWEGLAPGIENAFQTSYNHVENNSDFNGIFAFMGVFNTNKAVIVVEKGAPKPYDIIHKHLIHFDFDYLVELSKKSEEEIAATFIDIVMEMDEAPFPDIANVHALVADLNSLVPLSVTPTLYMVVSESKEQRAKSREQRAKYLTAR